MIIAPVPPTVAARLHGPVVTLLLVTRPPTPTLPALRRGGPTPDPVAPGGVRTVQITARSVFVTGDPGPLHLARLADVASVVAANHGFWSAGVTDEDPTGTSAPFPMPTLEAPPLVGVQERVDIPVEPGDDGREPDPLHAAMADLERRRVAYQVVAVQGAPVPEWTVRDGGRRGTGPAFLDRIGLLVRRRHPSSVAPAERGLPGSPGDLETRGPWVRARIVRGGEVVELITTRRVPRIAARVDADGLPGAVEDVLGSLAVGRVGTRAG